MKPNLSVCLKCNRRIDLTAVPVGILYGCCAKDDRDGELFKSCYRSMNEEFSIPSNCDFKAEHEKTNEQIQ